MAVTVQVSRLRTGSPRAGDEAAVVAAGRDDVADVGVFAAGDPCRNRRVEVAGGEAGVSGWRG